MTDIEAGAIGRRGRHPELGARFGLSGGYETEHRKDDPEKVEAAESKDETPSGSLEWKEQVHDD